MITLPADVFERMAVAMERMAVAMERQALAMEKAAARLDLLIQAMAESEPEYPDAQPLRYMDGSPCR